MGLCFSCETVPRIVPKSCRHSCHTNYVKQQYHDQRYHDQRYVPPPYNPEYQY